MIIAVNMTRVNVQISQSPYERRVNIRQQISEKEKKLLRVLVRLGSRIGREGEFADFVLNTSSFKFFLIFTNPCDLRMCVNNRWDGIIIDMPMTGLENFDGSDTYADVSQGDGCVQ